VHATGQDNVESDKIYIKNDRTDLERKKSLSSSGDVRLEKEHPWENRYPAHPPGKDPCQDKKPDSSPGSREFSVSATIGRFVFEG
jgi:hypothetical protein